MSQQVNVYRELSLKVPDALVKAGTPYESSDYIVDSKYGINIAQDYGASLSNRTWAVHINADTGGTDMTGDTYSGAIRGRLVIGTTQTNASLMGVAGCIDVGDGVDIQGNMFGLDGVLDFYGDTTAGSGAAFYAGAIRATVWNEGETTLGAGAVLSGIDLYEVGAIHAAGSGALNPAITIRGAWTSALSITATSCYAANTNVPAVATAFDIVVNLGGTTGYIPVYTDRTWNA